MDDKMNEWIKILMGEWMNKIIVWMNLLYDGWMNELNCCVMDELNYCMIDDNTNIMTRWMNNFL